MKIINIITSLGPGGAERMLHQVLTLASPFNHHHVVISLMDEGVYGASLRRHGVEVICLGMKNGTLSLQALVKLIRVLRTKKADVIMSWLYHADLMSFIAVFLGGGQIEKLIWNLRCSNIDTRRYALSTRLCIFMLSFFSRFIHTIVYNSNAGKNYHKQIGYKPERWKYLPNGFDLEKFSKEKYKNDRYRIRANLGITAKTVLFGLLARNDPQKDQQNFLNAARLLVKKNEYVHFLLIGEGIENIKIPKMLKARVSVLGYQSEITKFLSALDVNVLSSSFGEGFPNVIGESMAMGIPSIVTDVGDCSELVGCTGKVVPPNDADALSEAMLAFTNLSKAENRVLGNFAREKIEKNYNIIYIAKLYNDEWSYVANRSSRRGFRK